MKVAVPRLYLGSMTFGWSSQTSSLVDEKVGTEMLQKFVAFGKNKAFYNKYMLDTARIYAGGETENIIGSILKKPFDGQNSIEIGTKAHPSQNMGLSKEGLQYQLQQSMSAMGVDSVGEFYLHQPDTENSLLESLEYAHCLVMNGSIKSIGMSNYHASEMKRAFELCEENSLTKPTVYQGLYNPLNRLVEKELIPILKENGCSFVAYNPLAAGLLTGKHQKAVVPNGRFKDNQNYLPRFFTDDNFDGLSIIQLACDAEGVSLLEATFRWLLRHSVLDQNDGVLLGASSMLQLQQNLDSCEAAIDKGPLPDPILEAFEKAWEITEKSSFPYWRSYSSDMPARESLDHGASYSAAK